MSEEVEDQDFRSRISSMPLEQVMKLKSELGASNFNEVVLGKKKQKRRPPQLSRPPENSDDEAPMEMSSKVRVKGLGKQKVRPTGPRVRDPRFDSRCGEFKSHKFRENFEFVFDMKQSELGSLKQKLRETEDPEEAEKVKFVIQRTKNQLREHKKQMELIRKNREERQTMEQEGRRPQYMKKREKKMTELVSKFVELKESGGLKRHIEKRNKKSAGKIKKKMNL